ncbi:MAG: BatD family protein, partial [Planctomycetota bacterium]
GGLASMVRLESSAVEIPPIVIDVAGRKVATRPVPITCRVDLLGEQLGFIEWVGVPDRLVEGLPILVELRFGWDESIADETDYVGLSLPWWGEVDGAIVDPRPLRGGMRRIAPSINRETRTDAFQLERVVRGGRPFRGFTIPLELTPTRSGELRFETSHLQFGTLSFLGNSLTRGYFAKAEPLSLPVEPLPSEGQPTDFGRAIGRFEVSASADTRDVNAGDSIKLTVDWSGVGNFAYFEAPDPSRQPRFDGFRFFGMTEEKLTDRRRVTYDLAPLGPDVLEIPPLELPYFDVDAWEYRRLETEAIPIRVRALEGEDGLVLEDRFAEDLRDIRDVLVVEGGAEASAPSLTTLTGALVGMLLGWAALRAAVRQGGRDPGSTLERRRGRALRHLDRELRTSLDPETDLRAFASFMAARVGEDTEAWVGFDPREHFGAHAERPLSPVTLDDLSGLQEDLEAAVFGGGERVPRGRIRTTAKELLEDGL